MTMTNNTQGLDALAALCGTTAAATDENAVAAAAVAAVALPTRNSAAAPVPQLAPPPAPSRFAAASLFAQAHMQEQAHAQAAQAQAAQAQAAQAQAAQAFKMQQVQQALAMHQALQGQQQVQQQRSAAVQAAALQGQAQSQATMASTLTPQIVQQAQLGMLQAAATQHQQQQQQQTNSAFKQVQHAQVLAAQLLAQQQHQQQQHLANATVGLHTSLVAVSPSSSLASLAAASGGQVIPGAATADALTPPALQANTERAPSSSPSTLAMPPPPNVLLPSCMLGKRTSKSASKASNILSIVPKEKSPRTTKKAATSERLPQSAKQAEAAPQPPIEDIISEWEDKKQAKRAANRLSAHLSRKRKKLFIEDLKDENVELRRKEQILRSIPDLIAVFDSSGCISFVSHSVTRFSDYSAEELENTSFWDLLTVGSVRLIKSAFMDALATKRPPGEDSTPLANGESVTVELVHKKSGSLEEEDDYLLVSLKGVVHFTGESPECVCSIRPEGDNKILMPPVKESLPPPAASRAQHKRAAFMPTSVTPSHHISDIDSEKS